MQDIWTEIIGLGVDKYTIVLVLALPVVATIIGIARHYLGIKSLSMYAPIVLTYAFIELGFDRNYGIIRYLDGLRYGIVLFTIVFITAAVIYTKTKRMSLHFYPKLSLIFTGVSIMMLLTIIAAAYLGSSGFININIFSVVLISAVSERLVSTYAKTDFNSTAFITLETLVLTLICYTLVAWPAFQDFLLYSPWFLIVVVAINLTVGSHTELRLTEYWRFREILDKDYGANGNSKNTKK